MEWADQAVVLRIGHFRESDLWLKLLCRKRGLMTLFAFGGSHSRRRFCGCLDVLNTLQCRVKTSGRGNFLNLEEAALLSGPQRLRGNWQRMGLAVNCLRFVEALGVNNDGAEEIFALVEDLRHVLEEETRLPALLPLFFRLRLAGALGFAPNLGRCGTCGAPLTERALFVVDEGQMRCAACRAGESLPAKRYGVELSPAGLGLLRRVQQGFPSAWPVEDGPLTDRRACARAIDGFVQYHLGLAWEGGYFRRV
ncbi:DNA repair protein RecO [uncultured Desulfovibrio sp.]|uniref:DNA repair protein RecO n=1 Tax=uncultured Desulfovibrio sp. TaxID=167968 RepID=UPI0026250B50|nr:DNA repair protein RecO C-terminal domain-containing protein [uncultured Desulfovibrio sp.]